ncbi:MAG: thiamine-phosphate kinase [Candidatus Ratteibacteria bacterium]|nr:thiamine-phosphate kinase [Candidatus Ratteibacteria bacterium]
MNEDQIIEFIKRHLKPKQKTVVVGPGDDTAVLSYNNREYLLLTTDCIVEDVHFTRSEATLFQIARKSIAVNLSDIAAMGGIPLYALVCAGLPDGLTRRELAQLIKGLKSATDIFNFDIVGGNLTRSEKLFIDVSLTGKVEKRYLKLRSGAQPGDLIFVTGTLGGSYLKKHLTFTPRVKESRELIKKVPISAMMDISDGLSTDLTRLAKASGVGFKIYLEKIPVSQDAVKISKNSKEEIQHALCDGEDYELLFTVPKDYGGKVPDKINSVPVSCIGVLTKEKRYTGIAPEGKEIIVQPSGYSHF